MDRLGISRIRWENGNRGQAPYGYYYGMGLVYAALYERLKKGERIVKEICKPLGASKDVDALRRFQATIIDKTGNNLNDESNILRGLFLLMFGLGLMESNGRFCCGWDRGKEDGWGNPAKKIQPTAENSEAGLFQTSFDIISAGTVSTVVKNMLLNFRILQNPINLVWAFLKQVLLTSEKMDALYKSKVFSQQITMLWSVIL